MVDDNAAGAADFADAALRPVIADAPDGILLVDASGRICFANPMAARLFAYPPETLVGMSVDELVPESRRGPHAQHRASYAANPHARPMGTGLELRARRANGDEFPVEISLSPVAADNRVIAIVRDVTERRLAEAALQEAHDALALGEDRERIARNLHDTVVQRMFAIGLSLQSALVRIANDPVAERIENAIDEIDATIRDIRAAIFSLHTRRPLATSLREDVLKIGREAARALGYEPRISFDGPVDTMVDEELREELVAIVREGLSNIARHAQASEASVELSVEDGLLTLRVVDNGVGISPNARAGDGLANLRKRAEARAGTMEVGAPSNGRGTEVELKIRVDTHSTARD